MNLAELKTIVDRSIEQLKFEKPENVSVLITLSESSMGARASSCVKYAGLGFDWERGQFRFEPDKSLVTKGNNLIDIKGVVCRQYEGRNYYYCPRCQQKISKDDSYCRFCSQKLK
jgi:hypothetical protein